MAYDEYQAERIHRIFEEQKLDFYQKKMFSGVVFMLDEKMCVGSHIDKASQESQLMVRIGNDAYEKNQDRPGCRAMDFTGRRMKDFAFISPDGYDSDEELEYWVKLAIAFNPLAKASKKRKKKLD